MVFKYDKRCKVCKAIRAGDEKLAKRIAESKHFIRGGESLRGIAAEYVGQFSYQSIYLHTHKHQAWDEEALHDKRVDKMLKTTQRDQLRQVTSHNELRQAIQEEAKRLLDEGELKGWTVNAALKAAKDTSDIEEKQKDRAMEIMKMMNFYSSGEGEVIDGADDTKAIADGHTEG